MEYDENLLYNFASIIATILFTSAAGVTIIRRLKLRWPIGVNCWFCNSDTKIYHGERDWWRCPSCEQYNGFAKDGDYAYDIPEQSRQITSSYARRDWSEGKVNQSKENVLCDECNDKEELKVSELRRYEPSWFFDSGLERFKRELEVKYPLCDGCKDSVEDVLRKQSQWLATYKMLFFKEKSVNEIVHNAKRFDKTVRVLLTVLTTVMVYHPACWPLPFIGAFLQSGSFVIDRTRRRTSDTILALLWLCIGLIGPPNELESASKWTHSQGVTEYHFVTFLTLIIGFANVTPRYRITRSYKASFKKLESPISKRNSSSSTIMNDSIESFDRSDRFDSSVQSKFRRSSVDFETPLLKITSFAHDSRKREERARLSSGFVAKNLSAGGAETGRGRTFSMNENSEQYALNDSLSTLETLTLGDTRNRQSRKVPRIFKTRVYGSTSPDLFQRTVKPGTRKFILAPAKLKSPALNSWVAGGYWQVGAEPPSLSRSSSQSSGFGSAGSNFGPSREPSVNKEIDKFSAVPDAAQYCHAPRPNSVNSIMTHCQHGSHAPVSRCETPAYNQPLNITPNSLYAGNHPLSHFSPVHPEPIGRSNVLRNQNFEASALQESRRGSSYNAGYHAVLTNPVWLPALLCGSLVFNIAVFCTILLR